MSLPLQTRSGKIRPEIPTWIKKTSRKRPETASTRTLGEEFLYNDTVRTFGLSGTNNSASYQEIDGELDEPALEMSAVRSDAEPGLDGSTARETRMGTMTEPELVGSTARDTRMGIRTGTEGPHGSQGAGPAESVSGRNGTNELHISHSGNGEEIGLPLSESEEDCRPLIWADSSDDDEDQLGPLPKEWFFPRRTEWSFPVELNATIIELDDDSEAPPDIQNDSEPTAEPSRKGKETAEGEKPPKDQQRSKTREHVSRKEKFRHENSKRTSKKGTPLFRDSSQIPKGGYFERSGPHPDSSGESSESTSSAESSSTDSESSPNSSSSEDSDSSSGRSRRKESKSRRKGRKKKGGKKLKNAPAGVPIKQPLPYDGTANLDTLDHWTYNMDVYIELSGLRNAVAVKAIGSYLTGKAGIFYMKFVAMNRRKWTVKGIYEGLFDYCFPSDYKAELRKKLLGSYQGKNSFRDFARDLEIFAQRFPDITDRQLKQVLWDGATQYIRFEWLKSGCNPEITSWKKLVKRANFFEAAEQARLREAKLMTKERGEPPRPEQRRPFRPEKGGFKGYQREPPTGGKTTPNQTGRNDRRQNDSFKGDKKSHRVQHTKEKLNQLRAEGKCFNCEREGHSSRNCPDRHTAPAPKLASHSVDITEIENLASRKREQDIQSFAVSWCNPEDESLGVYAAGPARRNRKPPEEEGMDNLQWTSIQKRDVSRKFPRPVIVETFVNGKPARTLIDSGSLADFMSTTLADQLNVPRMAFQKPIPLQLAVHGSRSRINYFTSVEFRYQNIQSERKFDIANIDGYDLILGTPFLYQHKVLIGFNPARVIIESDEPLPLEGESIMTIRSAVATLLEDQLQELREQLKKEATDLCPDTEKVDLPPLRAVNHIIPLIDENKLYSWRPSRCPEALRALWQAKKKAYLSNGRWRVASGTNAAPMLIIPKAPKGDGKVRIRTVVDKREQNANTKKLTTPLPDIDVILRNVVRHPYRSLIDGKDAYEQIRVVAEHVPRTLFTTPDGTMESLTLQQGDCNGPATYQTLMNHIFAPHIGVFMDVYLDDVVIYSDSVRDHLQHIRTVFDILRREKLYLSADKMVFFAEELKVLGHIIDDKGIRMDPHKVSSVTNWKVPTNKSLLSSFLGAVGFLAGDCHAIRIPMAVLTQLTGTKPWKWGPTEQRAFDQVKDIVQKHRDQHRVALDYSPGAPAINLVTDACLTGASGTLTQGDDLKTAEVVSFWSGKFTSAQQNYPVHEQELLAIVESLKRFRPQLQGASFRICTDHKALEYIMTQKHLSPRQHRWVDTLNEFDFVIHYIPGKTNILADALSRIYSDETPGTVRARSEYVSENEELNTHRDGKPQTFSPVLTGLEAKAASYAPVRRSRRLAEKPHASWSTSHEKIMTPEAERNSLREETHNKKWRATGPHRDQGAQAPKELPQPDNEDGPSNENRGNHAIGNNGQAGAHLTGMVSAPPLTEVISDAEPGISLPDDLRGKFIEDKFFKEILEKPTHFKDFTSRDGLVLLKHNDLFILCIPDVVLGKRKVREIVISHAHSILAHLGARKTLAYLRQNVWWPGMIGDVVEFCKSCGICATSKSDNQKPMGLLRTIEVPKRPWQSIGIDFVGPLPGSTNRLGEFDQICVIIDHLTAMVHLVPARTTYKAHQMAEIIFDMVYKLHGLPERIISDRDSLFTSAFWQELHKLLGTELRLSSAYHPQTDGATERANRTMVQMLRQCVSKNQRDWVTKLPAIEYAMNCARSETTGFSPFFLNYGQMPRPLIWDSQTEYPGVRNFAQKMKNAIMAAHDEVIEARVKQTRFANKKRRAAEFKEGDLVYLSTKNLKLPKQRARKLIPKYIGPFRIGKVIEAGASYKLEISSELKQRGIHDVFHASLLRIHVPNDDRRFPGRQFDQIPGFGENPKEWAVDRVLSHVGQGTEATFEIMWKTGDVTWLTYGECKNLEPLSTYCEAMGIAHPKYLPKRVANIPDEAPLTAAMVAVPWNDTLTHNEPTKGQKVHIYRTERANETNKMEPSPHSSLSTEALKLLLDAQREAFQTGIDSAKRNKDDKPWYQNRPAHQARGPGYYRRPRHNAFRPQPPRRTFDNDPPRQRRDSAVPQRDREPEPSTQGFTGTSKFFIHAVFGSFRIAIAASFHINREPTVPPPTPESTAITALADRIGNDDPMDGDMDILEGDNDEPLIY